MSESSSIARMLLVEDEHDRAVIDNCRPPGYCNPTPGGRYNLVAIGAGAAGLVSSGGAGLLGGKAALIERTLLGGDCLNTGCVPSKGVIRAARAIHDARNARQFGLLDHSSSSIDFATAMERMRRLRARISVNDSAARFREKYGVDVYFGQARFVGPDEIEVEGTRLKFARAVIAAGGRPAELEIPGAREAEYFTNETIFTLTELPRRLIVVGGGPIGCELAQSFQRFGSQVTMLNRGGQILPREDADAAAIVERQLAREGMAIYHGVELLRLDSRGSDREMVFLHEGVEKRVAGDAVLVAAGRVPNLEGLDLEAAGVRYDSDGVLVDDFLRTSNPRIHAAGDVCSKYKFTHAADAMARLALRNALFLGRERMSRLVIPWCTYTDPEVAHVGWHEADARAAGLDVATITEHFADNDRAILEGDDEGLARVHYERRSGRILGGTIVARHAGEMISELTLAMTHKLKLGALATTIHPYPTQAEILRKIGETYQMARLSPMLRAWLRRWLAWKR